MARPESIKAPDAYAQPNHLPSNQSPAIPNHTLSPTAKDPGHVRPARNAPAERATSHRPRTRGGPRARHHHRPARIPCVRAGSHGLRVPEAFGDVWVRRWQRDGCRWRAERKEERPVAFIRCMPQRVWRSREVACTAVAIRSSRALAVAQPGLAPPSLNQLGASSGRKFTFLPLYLVLLPVSAPYP